ncbi:hypothetical protein D3C85_1656990 [compost metagenome]
MPGIVDQAFHQQRVSIEQMLFTRGLPGLQLLVNRQRVTRLLHILWRRDDALTVEDRGDLPLAQRISLNRQRALYGADTVDPPQA